MKLADVPPPGKVMMLGISSLDALMNVFNAVRTDLKLSAFEFLTDQALRHVCRAKGLNPPLSTPCPLYVVTEFDCPGEAEESLALECFSGCLESGWLLDGVISQSERQNRELWRYREEISESITPLRPYKNDLSVRVSAVPGFLDAMDSLMQKICPEFEVVWYGHIGDGNLHMNIIGTPGVSLAEFESRCHAISEETYALTQAFGGSISAEHGIGVLKKPWLGRVRSPEEIAMMQGIKRVFDPAGILNPGKLLAD
jgi:FAD/FMN-containing dehydrogenase